MYNWPIIKDIVPIFSWVLDFLHKFIPSYGWAIIVLTILFRAALLPLDIKSKISMKKQAALQPKIQKINEKYKNDKEKAAQKTMELYKQEKASPFSGCLPSLIQMPLFIAFFGALNIMAGIQMFDLYETVIKQGLDAATKMIEPWLWVRNVWAPDTALFGPNGFNIFGWNSSVIPAYHAVYMLDQFKGISEAQYNAVMGGLIARTSANYNGWLILPLLAGLTSWWQTKITMPPQTAQPDPNQAKNPLSGKTMQYLFPAMSVFFTAGSNAVFALYWITSNLVSIATFKTVDIVWKMREKKREQEELEKQEQAKLESARLAAEAEARKLEKAGGAKQVSQGKKNPKEGDSI